MAPEPSHPYTVLDVFTDTPLEGNPVAVFTAAEHIPSRLMQAVARELHLSETVFLLPGDPGAGWEAEIRIFTPATELPFAGHPTLGAAFVVGTGSGAARVRLRTGAGIVPVRLERDASGEVVFGEMEQPIPSVAAFEPEGVERLLAALSVERAMLPVEVYDNGPRHVMVALDGPGAVAALAPDLGALAALGDYGFSCFARDRGIVRTRMFGPALGVAEDPATGSAAGPLAVHLVRHGWSEFGAEVEIVQGVEISRRSVLRARVDGAGQRIQRITVGGAAVVVAHGAFRLQ
jgi:trans-2,3-dihydro-3-hydroxyanthranilate isomerase